MTGRKKRRLTLLGLGMLALAGSAALVLTAFEDNLVFFYSPSDVQAKEISPEQYVRMGGLVQEGSVETIEDGATVRFAVTDGEHAVTVRYRGLLPDLFREGQGVVTQGQFNADGVFVAQEVLAKHDENYMPPEVAEALKKSGKWEHMQETLKSGEAAQ
jgi:cytochrome c-type biogenesis protein CcmE